MKYPQNNAPILEKCRKPINHDPKLPIKYEKADMY